MPGAQGLPDIQFLPDGSLLNVQLKIMNLRKSSGSQLMWEQVNIIGQGSEGISQWAINLCTSPMIIHKIIPSKKNLKLGEKRKKIKQL